MFNTQIKFEGKMQYGSKVVAFRKNYTKPWSKLRSSVYELVRDLYVINTWLKFEGKIQNNQELAHSQG